MELTDEELLLLEQLTYLDSSVTEAAVTDEVDFRTGDCVGTRGYAAPEQYKGGSNFLDERTDIYSLGATLFFLLTGITPEKPPRAVPPIREINPSLSDGLHNGKYS